MTRAAARLHEEAAYLAHHLHWNLDDILDLEHHDRHRFVAAATTLAAHPDGRT